MFDPIEILGVLLVKRVVSEVSEVILGGAARLGQLGHVVLLAGQADEAVIV